MCLICSLSCPLFQKSNKLTQSLSTRALALTLASLGRAHCERGQRRLTSMRVVNCTDLEATLPATAQARDGPGISGRSRKCSPLLAGALSFQFSEGFNANE